MKTERQMQILRIISRQHIETQNQLLEALKNEGVNSTQATVSRDMRDLRLVKELDSDGNYHYVCPPESIGETQHMDRLSAVFQQSVSGCCCAQNLVIVKTLSGMANAAAAAIDSMEVAGMAGTLAGDDTIFIAMVDNASAERFCQEILENIR